MVYWSKGANFMLRLLPRGLISENNAQSFVML